MSESLILVVILAVAVAVAVWWFYYRCKKGTMGPKCQYTDATTCSGNGTVDFNGNCTCNAGFTGVNCATPPPSVQVKQTPQDKQNCASCKKENFVDDYTENEKSKHHLASSGFEGVTSPWLGASNFPVGSDRFMGSF